MFSHEYVVGTAVRAIESVLPIFSGRLPWKSDNQSSNASIKSQVFEVAPSDTDVRSTNSWTPGQASRLQNALTAVTSDDWKRSVIEGLSAVELGGVVASVGQLLSPQGPGTCDHCTADRVANVVTSIPYVLVGLHTLKQRKSDSGKFWGGSVAVVGLASTVFHATDGKWKSIGRKLDYWTIALSTNALLKAVFPSVPRPVTVAGIVATPFKPFAVSTVNSTAMEVEFLRRAHSNPKLVPAQRIHSAASLAGLACFALEDHHPTTPFIHTLWHGFSAVATLTINALLEDIEREQAGLSSSARISTIGEKTSRSSASMELDMRQLTIA